LKEGSHYVFKATGMSSDIHRLDVHTTEVNGLTYYYLHNPENAGRYYNEALDSAFFYKDRSQVFTVNAGTEKELHKVDPENPRFFQLVYNNASKPGDVLYAIWKRGNHFSIYTTEAFVDVETPAGKFAACMKIRVESFHVDEENMGAEVRYQYFAKGVGLVKHEKGNVRLELQSYEIKA
jgi:hypothetical protein